LVLSKTLQLARRSLQGMFWPWAEFFARH